MEARRTPCTFVAMTCIAVLAGSAGAQAPTYTPEQLADSYAAARQVYPYYWNASGSQAQNVDFAGAPIIRNKAVMFYEQSFGRSPRVWVSPDGSMIAYENGNIPQRTDWAAHEAEMRRDIEAAIPDPNWNGIAILDYETWEPVWELMHNERMRDESRNWVRQRFPGLSDEEVEAQAIAEFEAAGVDFMVRTLEFCKQMRPNTRWGYYGHPYPHHRPWLETHYRPIYDASTTLFPQSYAHFYSVPNDAPQENWQQKVIWYFQQGIYARVDYAKEVSNGQPVYSVIWVRYHNNNIRYGGQFLNPLDLDAILNETRIAGSDGAVFWDFIVDPAVLPAYRQYFQDFVEPRMREIYLSIAPPPPPVAEQVQLVSQPEPAFSPRVETISNPAPAQPAEVASNSGGGGGGGGAATVSELALEDPAVEQPAASEPDQPTMTPAEAKRAARIAAREAAIARRQQILAERRAAKEAATQAKIAARQEAIARRQQILAERRAAKEAAYQEKLAAREAAIARRQEAIAAREAARRQAEEAQQPAPAGSLANAPTE